jgi:hypothetical protein
MLVTYINAYTVGTDFLQIQYGRLPPKTVMQAKFVALLIHNEAMFIRA